MTTVYKCDICGFTSKDIELVRKCEERHIDNENMKVIASEYQEGKIIPVSIIVKINGYNVLFSMKHIITECLGTYKV